MHKQKIFKKLGMFKREKYPFSEYMSNNGFYLPSGLDLNIKQLNYIVKTFNNILK